MVASATMSRAFAILIASGACLLVGAGALASPAPPSEVLTGFSVVASEGGTAPVLRSIEVDPRAPAPSRATGEEVVARVRATLSSAAEDEEREEWVRALTRKARRLGAAAWILDLRAEEGSTPRRRSYLFKLAAVAVRGGDPDAAVFLDAGDPAELDSLYREELAAYCDGVILGPMEDRETAGASTVRREDPTARVWIRSGTEESAELAVLGALASGADGVVLDRSSRAVHRIMELLPGSFSLRSAVLEGGRESEGMLLRGEGRVQVVRLLDLESFETVLFYWKLSGSGEDVPRIVIDAAGLGRPRIEDLVAGEDLDPGLVIEAPRAGTTTFDLPGEVGRAIAVQFAALDLVERGERAERVRVEGRSLPPVERILARHQARRSDQEERLESWIAEVETNMQFSVAGSGREADLGIRSRLYHRRDRAPEFENLQYFLNGAPVRSKKIPNLPLVQPEKVQTLPLDLRLDKAYGYELVGEERIADRSAYRIAFRPLEGVRPAWKGEVWIDARTYERVRLRAVQTGVEAPILSWEQTEEYRDVEGDGATFRLPDKTMVVQTFTTLGATVTAEATMRYHSYDINPPAIEERLAEARSSDRQMMRDTDEGLRYLVKDPETGERVVEEPKRKARFWLAGVRWDRSLDYPVPLAGFNFLNFDWRGTGAQTNWFLAGVFNRFTISQPSLGGTDWGGSANVQLTLIPFKDRAFDAQGNELEEQDLKSFEESVELSLWRSLGGFFRLKGDLGITYTDWDRTDDTADGYRPPADNITGTFTTTLEYRRAGWRVDLWGSASRRSSWGPWGFEEEESEDAYRRWGLDVGKDWRLMAFQTFGASVSYQDGQDLDRFSRFQAGVFSNPIGGFAGSGLRWDTGAIARLRYGWSLLELAGVEIGLDWARVRDEAVEDAWFDNQGLTLSGSFTGPRGTVLNLDLGYALGSELFPEAEQNVTVQFLLLKLF